jgi:hypothetical protein
MTNLLSMEKKASNEPVTNLLGTPDRRNETPSDVPGAGYYPGMFYRAYILIAILHHFRALNHPLHLALDTFSLFEPQTQI